MAEKTGQKDRYGRTHRNLSGIGHFSPGHGHQICRNTEEKIENQAEIYYQKSDDSVKNQKSRLSGFWGIPYKNANEGLYPDTGV